MSEITPAEYEAMLRADLGYFAQLCFSELNPQTAFLPNWHIEVIAGKLAAVREGKVRRLIINLPPRHLKSLLASIALPAWCLGHDPSAQILCVSYAQDLADKLARHATGPTVEELIAQERQRSPSYGGRSVFGWEQGQASAKIGHSYGR